VHAIVVPEPGPPDVLTWAEVPDPEPGPGEVLVAVAASAVNRADLLQRKGQYPPPAGAPEYLGLECSGRVAALGDGVTGWQVGDEVCALLSGGGYAELVAVPAGQLLPVPAGVSLIDAAALPEVACTVWSNVVQAARLAKGETFLVHGGASGIGTHAIQVAAHLGARVFCTAGSAAKLERCRSLGADVGIDYKTEDFVERVREETGGRGVDVILDNMGAKYLDRNIAALARNGRLACIGMQGGTRAELDLGTLMGKAVSISAATLRGRPADEKAAVVAAVAETPWHWIADGSVRPIIDRTVPIQRAAEAHRLLEDSGHVGKVVLTLA
jgi:putative PIG3 family NAD(P)H quinone oxidoreductase